MTDDEKYKKICEEYDRHVKAIGSIDDATRTEQIALLQTVKAETLAALDRLDRAEDRNNKNAAAFMQALRYAFWTGFCYGMVASVFVVLVAYWWSHE